MKPVIAISSCILGNRVRYDGEIKHFPEICQQLQQHFQLLPVCPEVEMGLSVPRPPLQLIADDGGTRMVGRDDPSIDVSAAMDEYCRDKPTQLGAISGYVFKSRSPSCGLNQIPVLQLGKPAETNHRGLFAEAMLTRYPDLPVAQETELESAQQRQQFIQQVLNYYRQQSR